MAAFKVELPLLATRLDRLESRRWLDVHCRRLTIMYNYVTLIIDIYMNINKKGRTLSLYIQQYTPKHIGPD